ncbi:hypothetical protein GCM10022206_16870 [Streptomyces chiangmaiensis]
MWLTHVRAGSVRPMVAGCTDNKIDSARPDPQGRKAPSPDQRRWRGADSDRRTFPVTALAGHHSYVGGLVAEPCG